jgi:type II secretory pathway component PulF
MSQQTHSLNREFWVLTVIGFCFALFVAMLALWVVPQFDLTLRSFGTDLPSITYWISQAPWLFFLIPVSVLLIAFLLPNRQKSAVIACVFGVTSLFWGIAIMVGAMYLPIFMLAAAI